MIGKVLWEDDNWVIIEGGEGVSYVDIWSKSFLGRKNGKWKKLK